jgi:hypothetical protein
VRPSKDPAREPLSFTNEAEEEVLGLNRNTAKLGGLIAGEKEHAPRSFRVTFEHPDSYV